jgi:mono/diheme cytochrome c family protein
MSAVRASVRVLACTALLIGGSASADPDPITHTGKELYQQYCSACHGPEARGDGPVAATLKVEVPDLTLIARRNGGTFPRDRVERIIDGRHVIGAHGARVMPIWGEDLSRARPGDPDAERAARVITGRLADYLQLLQKSAPAN